MSSEAPTTQLLSVVVVAYAGPAYVTRCLAALDVQTDSGPYEVIVVFDKLSLPDALVAQHPATRWIADQSPDPARLRALGVAAARGALIAVTEDHCVPSPTWIRDLRMAHLEHRVAAIGGPLDKLVPDSALNWAGYLLEFGRYQPPLTTGDALYLTDCNVSYQRAALEAIRDVWMNAFHETTTHWALRDRGERLVLDARPTVSQQRSVTWWGGLVEKVQHGAVFGRTRLPGLSYGARAMRALSTPALPFVLTLRAVRLASARGRGAEAVRAIVPIFLFATGWALGELGAYAGIVRAKRD